MKDLYSEIQNTKINWKIAVAFSAILPLFNIINNIPAREIFEWHRILGNWLLTFLFLLGSWVINSIFYQNSGPGRKGFTLKRILLIVVVNAAFFLFFVFVAVWLLNGQIPESFFEDRSLSMIAFRGFVSIILIYVIQFTLYANRKAQEAVTQNEMLKTENLRARFETLREQVNPHFLFNSLSTLRSMIYSGDKNAEQFVVRLSEVYRRLLQIQEKEAVTLGEELQFADDYSFMLFARFEGMLFISKDIDENLLHRNIPTFTLQILVENCIKHNIISKEKNLNIKIYNSGLDALIVENNLQPKISRQEPSGFGLNNLIRRYELLGEKEAVTVFQDENVFRVKVRLLSY